MAHPTRGGVRHDPALARFRRDRWAWDGDLLSAHRWRWDPAHNVVLTRCGLALTGGFALQAPARRPQCPACRAYINRRKR